MYSREIHKNSETIEIAVWTNEEGARFTTAMLGSAAFIGELPLATALLARRAST